MLRMSLERTRQGLSKSALATRSGINSTTVWEIEAGRRTAYPKAAQAIANVLGWEGDPADLFKEIDE